MKINEDLIIGDAGLSINDLNNKVDDLDVVYEKTLTSASTSITISGLDIVKDGGAYEVIFIGAASDVCDAGITLNGVREGYSQSAFGYTYNNTTSSGDNAGTVATGYRPYKQWWYYGIALNKGFTSIVRFNLYLSPLLKTSQSNCPYAEGIASSTQVGRSWNYVITMQQSKAFDNITSITVTSTSTATFSPGTRLIVRKKKYK